MGCCVSSSGKKNRKKLAKGEGTVKDSDEAADASSQQEANQVAPTPFADPKQGPRSDVAQDGGSAVAEPMSGKQGIAATTPASLDVAPAPQAPPQPAAEPVPEPPQTPDDAAVAGPVSKEDLARIGILGCGAFGVVDLWEHRRTKRTYAMKSLSKGYIISTGTQDKVINEKNVLMMLDSVFIIKLYATYNEAQTLCFLMEPALGGELMTTYHREGLHGSEKHTKFYIAGVVFALQHCHDRNVIYRDLKPENLLLTDAGHVKVTDMGLAKVLVGDEKAYTECGSPCYIAPEMIMSTGQNHSVDWWALGILLFELMSGHPPFEGDHPYQIQSRVMQGIGQVTFPSSCEGDVGDLIRAILRPEPGERLPMLQGGSQNVKDSSWFRNFDWQAMSSQECEPPYKPVVKSSTDISNFKVNDEDMPPQVDYEDDGTGWDKDFAQ